MYPISGEFEGGYEVTIFGTGFLNVRYPLHHRLVTSNFNEREFLWLAQLSRCEPASATPHLRQPGSCLRCLYSVTPTEYLEESAKYINPTRVSCPIPAFGEVATVDYRIQIQFQMNAKDIEPMTFTFTYIPPEPTPAEEPTAPVSAPLTPPTDQIPPIMSAPISSPVLPPLTPPTSLGPVSSGPVVPEGPSEAPTLSSEAPIAPVAVSSAWWQSPLVWILIVVALIVGIIGGAGVTVCVVNKRAKNNESYKLLPSHP